MFEGFYTVSLTVNYPGEDDEGEPKIRVHNMVNHCVLTTQFVWELTTTTNFLGH